MVKYPEVLEGKPRRRRGWWRILRHLPGLSVLLMASVLVAVVLYPYVVITVPSGQVGVLWKRFNGIEDYCWCFVGRGTILDPDLERHFQGRRQCRRAAQHPLPAAAQFRRCDPQIHRSGLSGVGGQSG